MTNGLVNLSPSLALLLYVGLALALVIITLRFLRSGKRAGAVWLLVFTSVTLISLVIAINEALKIMTATRIRYIMPLWPLTALLAGASLWRLATKHRILVTGMLVLWLISGAWLVVATDYRYELGHFFSGSGNFHHMHRMIQGRLPEADLIILDKFAIPTRIGAFYFNIMLGLPLEIVSRHWEDPYKEVRPVHEAYPYMWFLYPSEDRKGYADLPQVLGRVLCERMLDEWGFTLERYALSSVENCPDKPVRLAFDSEIQLTAPEITLLDGLLRLDAHFRSADDYLLSYYSLAVHVIDESGERVAQGDTGVGPGAIVPLRSEIDVSACRRATTKCASPYTTGRPENASPARDLETGETGDMHILQRFPIG